MNNPIPHPLMRYHGGKFRLAPWVMGFFPPHDTYVEPFGGAASVLLQKPRSTSEVYNDLDGDVVNVFRVLQRPHQSADLKRLLAVTPYARDEFNLAYEPADDPVERARRTLIRAQMGFGSAGATKGKTGFRVDSAPQPTPSMKQWGVYHRQLSLFVDRLAGVLIENKPAVEVIANHDRRDTLFYVDPPYVHSTRCNLGSNRYYQHEMTDDDHAALIDSLLAVKGLVVLSGYDNPIYSDRLGDWARHQTEARIGANRGAGMRTEAVWLNPACAERQRQQGFNFEGDQPCHAT
jgi:DNA adenine methylase